MSERATVNPMYYHGVEQETSLTEATKRYAGETYHSLDFIIIIFNMPDPKKPLIHKGMDPYHREMVTHAFNSVYRNPNRNANTLTMEEYIARLKSETIDDSEPTNADEIDSFINTLLDY